VLDNNRQVRIARNVVFLEDSTSVDNTEKNVHIDSVIPVLELDPVADKVDSEGENSDDDVDNPNVNVQAEASNEVHAERRYPSRDRRTRKCPGFVSYFSPVDTVLMIL
jgi:flagellar basal body rod protein FlgC